MHIGLFGLNAAAPIIGPDETIRFARLAEEIGYESWWAGEHVVLPSPRVPPAPMEPDDPILDPMVHLAFVAAVTRRMKLGTGIIILPQRNPLVLAKQAATLDVLAAGRLVLGIGAGYLEPEMTAIGVSMHDRGAKTDEYIDAMRAIWSKDAPVSFHGRHVEFAGIDAHPRPVQLGGPAIVIGGHSRSAHRRAVARGHGWYGFNLTVDVAAEQVAGLRAAAAQVDRSAALGRLEISVTPRGRIDQTMAQAYADAGVDRLVCRPLPNTDAATIERNLHDLAPLIAALA